MYLASKRLLHSAFLLLLISLYQKQQTSVLLELVQNEKEKRPRKWVREFYKLREEFGTFNTVFRYLKDNDEELFFQYTRMNKEQFSILLDILRPRITRQTTKFRSPISPDERFMITLRYLATGESQRSLSFQFRVGRSTISHILRSTSLAIWDLLSPKFLPSLNKDVINESVKKFYSMWNFPNCFGAVDGKHIRIRCPWNSGSDYYNYKKFYSFVLIAVADADYRFLMVDIGAPGRLGDSSVFPKSEFGKAFYADKFELPEDANIPRTEVKTPYCLIGDDAFPLKKNFMKPYGGKNLTHDQKVFNYRLSRARRVVENTFGILVSRWRIFKTEIHSSTLHARLYTKAACCLHNFLMDDRIKRKKSPYCPPGFVDKEDPVTHKIIPGEWRSFVKLENVRGDRSSNSRTRLAEEIRETFKTYFTSECGALPWQDRVVKSTSRKRV